MTTSVPPPPEESSHLARCGGLLARGRHPRRLPGRDVARTSGRCRGLAANSCGGSAGLAPDFPVASQVRAYHGRSGAVTSSLSLWPARHNLPRRTEEGRMKIEGGCLCGKVRYSADSDPAFVGLCHCKNCQKGTGTAFSLVVALPKPTLNIQGTLKTFTGRGDSGKATYRRFCPECGSALIDEAEIMPDVAMILAGTLDDASWIKPAMEIYCDSAQPWVSLGGERQRFPKMPMPG